VNEAERRMAELMPLAKKHGGNKVRALGYVFDSHAEYLRYLELRNLLLAGEIRDLIVHPEYELVPPQLDARGASIPRLGYTADFEYQEEGQTVVEEVKAPIRYTATVSQRGKLGKRQAYRGTRTEAYRIRVNLFRRRFPAVQFREISMGR